jgi:hypothetical protein
MIWSITIYDATMTMINITLQNTTQPYSDGEDEIRSLTSIIFLAFILIIFIFLAVFGNILVVMAVLKTPSLREEKSNLLVINLAVTDMLNGMTVMLSTLVSLVMDVHVLPYMLCNLICAANYCFIITSMMTLCYISIDRFHAIIFPLTYVQRINGKVIGMAIASSWIEGIIFSIVPVILNWIKYDYWEITCAIQWHQENDNAIYYVIVAFIVCFLVPGLVLAFNYIKILREAKKKMKVWALNIRSTTDKCERKKIKQQSASAKAVRSLLIVVLAYFICMTPFSVTKLIKVTVVEPILPGFVNVTSSIFAFASSVVNPLIYGIFRRDFRQAFKNMIRKRQTEAAMNKIYPTSTVIMDEST